MPEVATVVEILPATPSNECIPPAIIQFPSPVINQEARRHGGVIIHILVAAYMFIGLAIVCDDYFVPALTRVSDGEILLHFALFYSIIFMYNMLKSEPPF